MVLLAMTALRIGPGLGPMLDVSREESDLRQQDVTVILRKNMRESRRQQMLILWYKTWRW